MQHICTYKEIYRTVQHVCTYEINDESTSKWSICAGLYSVFDNTDSSATDTTPLKRRQLCTRNHWRQWRVYYKSISWNWHHYDINLRHCTVQHICTYKEVHRTLHHTCTYESMIHLPCESFHFYWSSLCTRHHQQWCLYHIYQLILTPSWHQSTTLYSASSYAQTRGYIVLCINICTYKVNDK